MTSYLSKLSPSRRLRGVLPGTATTAVGSFQRFFVNDRCQNPHRIIISEPLLEKRRRSFSSSSSSAKDELADRCNIHLLHSPFPPIPEGPYPPLFEFVTQHWKKPSTTDSISSGTSSTSSGGYLKDQIAIIDGSTGLQRTFHDYYITSCGLAAALSEMGINEDGCVAMYCPNHVDYLPVTLAISLLGAKMTPINPLYTTHELELVLERSRSSVLIAHTSTLKIALEAAGKCPQIQHVIVLNDDGQALPEGTVDLHSLRHSQPPVRETNPVVHHQTDIHPFLLPYSSGTTGLPKGVVLTHANLVANLLQFDEVEGLSFPPHAKLISPLPFFHIYAFTGTMMYCAWRGQQVITTSTRFDLEQFCQLVQQHQPQRAHLVPPILLGIAKHPIVDQYDLSSLQMIVSAAAPLSKETEADVKNRIRSDVKQAWGMSELSPIGTCNSDFNVRSGSIGPLVSSTFGKVVDEHGKSLPPHQSGELLIKGPQVMLGYMDEPDKTAECLSESGWLRTGDLAYYDEDGFLYISDRLKELIKVRGYPVAPAELEALLLTHPAVGDCAVIQVSCDRSGELPKAYVVLKGTEEARQVTAESLYEWVKERVAAYKRLDGGIEFIDSIPKSASGKILRRILRDQAKAEGK